MLREMDITNGLRRTMSKEISSYSKELTFEKKFKKSTVWFLMVSN